MKLVHTIRFFVSLRMTKQRFVISQQNILDLILSVADRWLATLQDDKHSPPAKIATIQPSTTFYIDTQMQKIRMFVLTFRKVVLFLLTVNGMPQRHKEV